MFEYLFMLTCYIPTFCNIILALVKVTPVGIHTFPVLSSKLQCSVNVSCWENFRSF